MHDASDVCDGIVHSPQNGCIQDEIQYQCLGKTGRTGLDDEKTMMTELQ